MENIKAESSTPLPNIEKIAEAEEEFPTVFNGIGSDIKAGSCSGCGGTILFAINLAVS